MKKIVAITALSLLATAKAFAGNVGAEVRWADSTNEQAFSFADDFKSPVGAVRLGLEVETINEKTEGATVNTFTGNVGMPVAVGKLSVEPFVQAGAATVSFGDDIYLVGGGLKAELPVWGPFSVGAEYRYRESVRGPELEDQRATGFVRANLDANWSVKAVFHNHFGDWNDKQWGVGLSYRF